jgi:hypothetical protein
MKRFIKLLLICVACLSLVGSLVGCAQYQRNYDSYTATWAKLAENQGKLFSIGVAPDGKIQSIEMGNFAVAMAMMSGFQKPSSEMVEMFKSVMNIAPYAALFGVATIGMQNAGQGNTNTTVFGDGNISNSQAGTTMGASPSSVSNTNVTIPLEAAGVIE